MSFNNNSGGAQPARHLSTDEMAEVAQVILEAYRDVVANHVGDQKTRIASFVAGFVLTQKPYLLVTPEGLDLAIKEVFENKHVTDFVFTLLYTFGSRWGMSQEKLEALAGNLASGAAPIAASDMCSIPNALASRLASFQDAYRLLVANSWLVVLLLLQLFFSAQPQKA